MTMNDRLALVIRFMLGALFLFAGVHKIIDPAGFAVAVYNYRILPDEMVNMVALVLPWVELILGICLVAGWWLPGAAVLTSVLFFAFTSALIFNAIRGLNIDCGCFYTEPGAPAAASTGWYIARDLLLLAVSVCLSIHTAGKAAEKDSERG